MYIINECIFGIVYLASLIRAEKGKIRNGNHFTEPDGMLRSIWKILAA